MEVQHSAACALTLMSGDTPRPGRGTMCIFTGRASSYVMHSAIDARPTMYFVSSLPSCMRVGILDQDVVVFRDRHVVEEAERRALHGTRSAVKRP